MSQLSQLLTIALAAPPVPVNFRFKLAGKPSVPTLKVPERWQYAAQQWLRKPGRSLVEIANETLAEEAASERARRENLNATSASTAFETDGDVAPADGMPEIIDALAGDDLAAVEAYEAAWREYWPARDAHRMQEALERERAWRRGFAVTLMRESDVEQLGGEDES